LCEIASNLLVLWREQHGSNCRLHCATRLLDHLTALAMTTARETGISRAVRCCNREVKECTTAPTFLVHFVMATHVQITPFPMGRKNIATRRRTSEAAHTSSY
jgi:hypothetical protein